MQRLVVPLTFMAVLGVSSCLIPYAVMTGRHDRALTELRDLGQALRSTDHPHCSRAVDFVKRRAVRLSRTIPIHRGESWPQPLRVTAHRPRVAQTCRSRGTSAS